MGPQKVVQSAMCLWCILSPLKCSWSRVPVIHDEDVLVLLSKVTTMVVVP